MDTNGIIVSSRARIARNLREYPFPNRMTREEGEAVISLVDHALNDKESPLANRFILHRMEDISYAEKSYLLEKHLISKELIDKETGALFLNKDESLAILVNEEDHLRIQSFEKGFDVQKAYENGEKLEDELSKRLKFSFQNDLGYLTACPTNLGTGLRISFLCHLPGIIGARQVDTIVQGLRQVGLTARGIYGEGSEIYGNMFQVSNQITLGISESDIIQTVEQIAQQLMEKEISAEEWLKSALGTKLDDRVARSLGILKYSRRMDVVEAMGHLSNIKIGLNLDLIEGLQSDDLEQAIITIQPNNLDQYRYSYHVEERNETRAEYLRNLFQTTSYHE